MDTADLLTPKPAQLLRRMLAPSAAGEATISRDGGAPMARFSVEAIRGRCGDAKISASDLEQAWGVQDIVILYKKAGHHEPLLGDLG